MKYVVFWSEAYVKSLSILTFLECPQRLNNIVSTSMLYGQPLHRCSYDNSTISSVNKLKNGASLLVYFLHFSFTFLSNLFCVRSLCQRVVLLNLLDTKVNPNSLLFSQRERERVREREREGEREREREREKMSRRSPVVRGWSGGAG